MPLTPVELTIALTPTSLSVMRLTTAASEDASVTLPDQPFAVDDRVFEAHTARGASVDRNRLSTRGSATWPTTVAVTGE